MRRAVAVALTWAGLLAAGVAGCGGDPVDTTGTGDHTLLRGEGPPSLMLALEPYLLERELAADGWMPVPYPYWTPVAECEIIDHAAVVDQGYVQGAAVIHVSAQLFDDARSAQDAAELMGTGGDECWAATWSLLTDDLLPLVGQGLDHPETDQVAGEIVPSFIEQPGTWTRRLVATGVFDGLEFNTTLYTRGAILFSIGTVRAGDPGRDEQRDATVRIHRHHARMADTVAGDPALDASLDRILATVGPLPPTADIALPGRVRPTVTGVAEIETVDAGCGLPAAPAVVAGPSWAWPLANDLHQVGRAHPDGRAAGEAVEALAATDPRCWFEADGAAGTYVRGSSELVERDGRTVAVSQYEVETDAAGMPTRVRRIRTLTADGAVTVGWEFSGIEGDEPDPVALTVLSAARLPTG